MPSIADKLKQYPSLVENKRYGTGQFRRYMRFTRLSDQLLSAKLIDSCHAFDLSVEHNQTHLLHVEGQWHRHPTTGCAGAGLAMQKLSGLPLSSDVFSLRRLTDAKTYCTHMFDLLSFAVAHIHRQRSDRLYQIDVHDTVDYPQPISLYIDDEQAYQFKINETEFIEPEFMIGAPTRQGLYKWAKKHLDEEKQEIAVMAQMALFVSYSQHFDLNAMAGEPALAIGPSLGSCYALQPERAENSRRLPSQRESDHIKAEIIK